MYPVMDQLFLLLDPIVSMYCKKGGGLRENGQLHRRCMQHMCDRFLDCKAYPQSVRFMVLSTIAKLCLHGEGCVSPPLSQRNTERA